MPEARLTVRSRDGNTQRAARDDCGPCVSGGRTRRCRLPDHRRTVLMSNALEIKNLTARLGDLEILKGIDLTVPFGEVHALMGPNGSGKSTLTHVLMGNDAYEASGSALVGGVEVMGLPVHERARAGLFEAFQYPTEVAGVSLDDLVTEMIKVAADRTEARERTCLLYT